MIAFIILSFIFNAAFGQTNTPASITIEIENPKLFNIDSYREKICKSEPTCKLIDDAPKELTTLNTRNCMCDEECATYGDCCLDSKYYNKDQQKQNFEKYQCSFVERIYMITKCPSNYNNDSVKTKCEKSMLPLDTEDTKLIIPVTDTKSRITYGNEYCAQCNGQKTYQAWNLTSYCSIALNEYIERDDFKQNYPLANLDNDTSPTMSLKAPSYRVENLADLTENSTLAPVLNDLLTESENAAKYIKFDASSKTFRSTYNGKNFTCSYGRIAPKNLDSYLRPCRLLVSQCSGKFNQTQDEKCRSYTSIVFDNFGAYRNKDCAACNGVLKSLPGCFSSVTFAPASNLFSTKDKPSGVDPCSNPAAKNKFCR